MNARRHLGIVTVAAFGSAVMTAIWLLALAVLVHSSMRATPVLLSGLIPIVLVHIAVDCRMAITAWNLRARPAEK